MRRLPCARYAPSASFVDVENPARFYCHTRMATKSQIRPHLSSRRRGASVFPIRRARHELRPAGRLQPGLETCSCPSRCLAHETLLDSYEMERRPVAELVTKSGDASEHTLTMADPTECKSRNLAINKATIARPKTLHHEIVAETELNIDYAHSPIVFGDANSSFAAGYRLPDNVPGSNARSRCFLGASCAWPTRGQYSDAVGRTRRRSDGIIGSERCACRNT